MGFRPCGASHFLLLRQKKVSKEKATLGRCWLRRFPALLGLGGGCATRGYAPQTVLAESPRRSCVARHLSRGPVNRPGLRGCRGEFDFCPFFAVDRNRSFFRELFQPSRLSGPRVKRRATQALAERGRGLSEGRSPEFRSPRQRRVAQGSRRSRPRNLGSPFLCLLSFGEAKESETPARRNPAAKKLHRPR